jgi:hypothetical protein
MGSPLTHHLLQLDVIKTVCFYVCSLSVSINFFSLLPYSSSFLLIDSGEFFLWDTVVSGKLTTYRI